ncbi:MAG: TIGR00159 family protein [Chloroflexi bacterium]|nr:TIGR00159 family protein [Chloroflexota bacterium]
MDALFGLLGALFGRFALSSFVDIGIVALVLYWLLTLISGTSAATLVRGVLILLTLAFALSNWFNLTMLQWLLRNSLPAFLVAIPVLFAPELRRALEQLGRAGALIPRAPAAISSTTRAAEAISTAAQRLSERRWGALIVIERETALGEYAASGIPIDGVVSVDLLLNIFYPNSPLHDGAVIVRGDRIVAAGAVLPLAQSEHVEQMGTRHRAAIGISERSDAIAVVVSEETGIISIGNAGRMVRNLGQGRLLKVLSILEKVRTTGGAATWRTRLSALARSDVDEIRLEDEDRRASA